MSEKEGAIDAWSLRIPLAIEKAEQLLTVPFPSGPGMVKARIHLSKKAPYIVADVTKIEVGLAKDLAEIWNYMECQAGAHVEGAAPISDGEVPPALIAFTEKIESL